MTQAGAGGAFDGRREEFTDDTPTPPTGLSLGGSPPPGPARRDGRAEAEDWPTTDAERTDPGQLGLAELLAAEDVGRAGPAVLGADPVADSSADAGDWPTLQRRERRPERPRPGPLDWVRRRTT
ncbi:hypothetical protein ABZ805_07955 [Saccharopolyspora sp. NPDC047091]|uniref:hypothetical protein n=1 Tax=Saccharopolyspora sp. NPDC047091 TaxID=3155924 RepID=UPI00340A5D90